MARVAVGRPQRGSVTAELAVALVAVAVVLAAVLATASVAVAQLRCADAARAGARAAARGESAAAVEQLARRLAGAGAEVSAAPAGELVRVSVTTRTALPLPGSPAVVLRASAAVPVEPAP